MTRCCSWLKLQKQKSLDSSIMMMQSYRSYYDQPSKTRSDASHGEMPQLPSLVDHPHRGSKEVSPVLPCKSESERSLNEMADLSFLPPIGGDAIEVDPLDLDNYQPPSETPLPLPVGNYLLRLIDGAIEKKDSDGIVEGVFPLLFDLTAKGYLKVTYSVVVVGRIERNPDKTETVTEEVQGPKPQSQRVHGAP